MINLYYALKMPSVHITKNSIYDKIPTLAVIIVIIMLQIIKKKQKIIVIYTMAQIIVLIIIYHIVFSVAQHAHINHPKKSIILLNRL